MLDAVRQRSEELTSATPSIRLGLLIAVLSGSLISLYACGSSVDAAHEASPGDRQKHFILREAGSRLNIGIPLFRSKPEGLPNSVQQVAGKASYKLEGDQAQYLEVDAPAKVWAVPGNGVVCLLTQESSAAVGVICDSVVSVLRRGLSVTFLSSSATRSSGQERYIVGIAPSRATAVVARTRSESVSIPVIAGVFFRRDDGNDPPDQISPIFGP